IWPTKLPPLCIVFVCRSWMVFCGFRPVSEPTASRNDRFCSITARTCFCRRHLPASQTLAQLPRRNHVFFGRPLNALRVKLDGPWFPVHQPTGFVPVYAI